MPTNRITMRRIRETLRLHLQAKLSYTEVGRALKVSKRVVGKYVSPARAADVDWDRVQSLSDEELEARLFRPAVPRSSHQLAPDFAFVHQELKRAGVTLMLLWEEYARDNPQAYKYTSFCIKYRAFALTQQRSMRQIHIAGEKLFVDDAGGAVPIIDAATGEISQAQIFVATLGASNYTFACATARQTTADWSSTASSPLHERPAIAFASDAVRTSSARSAASHRARARRAGRSCRRGSLVRPRGPARGDKALAAAR